MSQTPREVTLQLQANVVVLCAKQLLTLVTENPNDAEKLSCVSRYGAQFGVTIPIQLLKLEIDFSKQEMKFKELLVLPMCPGSGAYMYMYMSSWCAMHMLFHVYGYCPILHI